MTCARGCCDTPAEHYRSVRFGRGAAQVFDIRDKRWERDHAAYRRLRSEGLQPENLDGCAEMEARARTRFEIESGQLMVDESNLARRIQQGQDLSRAMGMTAGKDEL